MEKKGSWVVLPFHPEFKVQGFVLPANSHGIRLTLDGSGDQQAFAVRKELMRLLHSLMLGASKLEQGGTQDLSGNASGAYSEFVSLVCSWVLQRVLLQQVRIETAGAMVPEARVSIITSEEAQLQGVRLRLPAPNLATLLGLLSTGPSSLVKVSLHFGSKSSGGLCEQIVDSRANR